MGRNGWFLPIGKASSLWAGAVGAKKPRTAIVSDRERYPKAVNRR